MEQTMLKQILDSIIVIEKEVKGLSERQEKFEQEMLTFKKNQEEFNQEMLTFKKNQEEFNQEMLTFKKKTEETLDDIKEELADFKVNMITQFGYLNKNIAENMAQNKEAISADFRKFKKEVINWANDDIVFYLGERDKKINKRLEEVEAKLA